MADYREVQHVDLYVKVPGTDKLRKTAVARLRYLLSTGWREMERWHHPDHITVRVERTGHAPLMTKLPKPPPPLPRGARPGGPPRGAGGPGGGGPGAGGPGRGAAGAPRRP